MVYAMKSSATAEQKEQRSRARDARGHVPYEGGGGRKTARWGIHADGVRHGMTSLWFVV